MEERSGAQPRTLPNLWGWRGGGLALAQASCCESSHKPHAGRQRVFHVRVEGGAGQWRARGAAWQSSRHGRPPRGACLGAHGRCPSPSQCARSARFPVQRGTGEGAWSALSNAQGLALLNCRTSNQASPPAPGQGSRAPTVQKGAARKVLGCCAPCVLRRASAWCTRAAPTPQLTCEMIETSALSAMSPYCSELRAAGRGRAGAEATG